MDDRPGAGWAEMGLGGIDTQRQASVQSQSSDLPRTRSCFHTPSGPRGQWTNPVRVPPFLGEDTKNGGRHPENSHYPMRRPILWRILLRSRDRSCGVMGCDGEF